jgi:2',3'-cyclic-nucleotide 2'-phosphodiesterase
VSDNVNALVLGDIVGQPGCRALFVGLKGLIKRYKADFVVVNGENAAGGFGLTVDIADKLFAAGVDIITSGNHIWQKQEILSTLEKDHRILRPANYPKGVPGSGLHTVVKKDFRFTVMNLQGRVRMYDVNSPFETALSLYRSNKDQSDAIIVDFHAELPMEKEALALYLDGKVQAVVGTHTHIQTADERILPGGTAFITDLGMTGPSDSVIGVDPRISIQRSLTQMPIKMNIVDTPGVMRGVNIELSREGRAVSIERIQEYSGF